MSTKILAAILLVFAVQNIYCALVPLKGRIDEGLLGSVYYDPKTGLKLKGVLETSAKSPLGQLTFRGLACQCEKLVCSCCAGVNITLLKIDQQLCTTVTYVPEDFAIRTAVSLNKKELFATKVSAKNPPPLCLSIPNLPSVSFCIRIFDIYTSGKNLHACLDIETRITNAPVLVLHFNCMQIGTDGLSWGYPDNTSMVNIVQTQTQDSHTEEYDDVDFEPEDQESSTNSSTTDSNSDSSSTSQEDEDHIGQLKL